MNYYLAVILAGYLLGSMPWGLWVGQLLGKGDIRKTGSGNFGATNVYRTMGSSNAQVPSRSRILEIDAESPTDEEAIRRLFLATLSRFPSDPELTTALKYRSGEQFDTAAIGYAGCPENRRNCSDSRVSSAGS